jgi:hypothetical protein
LPDIAALLFYAIDAGCSQLREKMRDWLHRAPPASRPEEAIIHLC